MDPSTAEGVMVLDDSVGVMCFYGNLIRQGGSKVYSFGLNSQHSQFMSAQRRWEMNCYLDTKPRVV